MRVDRDDRYVTEQSSKDSTPPLQLPGFFHSLSKKKLIIVGLVVVIILLLLSLIIFRSSQKKEPTPTLLTPDQVSGVESTETTNNPVVEGSTEQNNTVNNAQPGSVNPTPTNAPESNYNQVNIPETPEVANNNIPESSPAYTQNTAAPGTQNPVTRTSHNEIVSNTTTHANNTNNIKPNNRNQKNASTRKEGNRKVESTNSSESTKINNERYTIQISASTSADKLKEFVKKHNITNYQIYETQRNTVTWFVLTKGNYASMNEAKKAIKSLPNGLQKDKPWVRSGASLNKEKVIQ